MSKDIKTQSLEKVLTMSNTDGVNFISEHNGKIYRTPFKEEYKVSNIEIDDVLLFHDVISNGEGTNKILGIEYGELLSPIIDPDENPVYTERLDTSSGYSVVPLEKGAIDPEDGDWLDWDDSNPYIRSAIYIPIVTNEEYNFSCASGTILRLRIMLCDSAKRIIRDKWNNGITNYKEININTAFSTTLTEAKYLMFDVEGNGDPSVELLIDKILPPKYEYLTVKKVRLLDDYSVTVSDTLESNTKQIEISHNKPSAESATYTFKAPTNRPLDTKIRLLNAGVKTSQFVDLRSIRDNDEEETVGRFEIGVRSFEEDTPIPEFVVGFANNVRGQLIHKFTIEPDAMPIKLTSKGIEFRLNNTNNNNAGSDELKTINFGELSTKVDSMYTSLIAHQLLVDQTLPEEVELVNIKATNVDYDSDDFPTVAEALDFLIANNNYLDVSVLQNQMNSLTNTMNTLNTEVDILDKTVGSKMAELNGIVKTYDANIKEAINKSEEAYNLASGLESRIATNETNIEQNTKDIASIRSDLDSAKITLSNKTKDLEDQMSSLMGGITYPKNRVLTYTNSENTYYVNTSGTAIASIPYNITLETIGIISFSTTIISNTDNVVTISFKVDGVEQNTKFKQTIKSGYNTISVNYSILPELMNQGDHAIQVVATCDTDTVLIDINSVYAILHLIEEID